MPHRVTVEARVCDPAYLSTGPVPLSNRILTLARTARPCSSTPLVWWNASSMVSSERQRRRAADFLAPSSKPEQPPGRPYS
jgi:hypothetical protein